MMVLSVLENTLISEKSIHDISLYIRVLCGEMKSVYELSSALHLESIERVVDNVDNVA